MSDTCSTADASRTVGSLVNFAVAQIQIATSVQDVAQSMQLVADHLVGCRTHPDAPASPDLPVSLQLLYQQQLQQVGLDVLRAIFYTHFFETWASALLASKRGSMPQSNRHARWGTAHTLAHVNTKQQ